MKWAPALAVVVGCGGGTSAPAPAPAPTPAPTPAAPPASTGPAKPAAGVRFLVAGDHQAHVFEIRGATVTEIASGTFAARVGGAAWVDADPIVVLEAGNFPPDDAASDPKLDGTLHAIALATKQPTALAAIPPDTWRRPKIADTVKVGTEWQLVTGADHHAYLGRCDHGISQPEQYRCTAWVWLDLATHQTQLLEPRAAPARAWPKLAPPAGFDVAFRKVGESQRLVCKSPAAQLSPDDTDGDLGMNADDGIRWVSTSPTAPLFAATRVVAGFTAFDQVRLYAGCAVPDEAAPAPVLAAGPDELVVLGADKATRVFAHGKQIATFPIVADLIRFAP